MEKKFFATIDIGSNAIRMMIVEVLNQDGKRYLIHKKQRAQLRLGHDVFSQGLISPHTMQGAKHVFLEFRQIISQFPQCQIICAATSATREASNRQEFIDYIQKETGISIEVISGDTEGDLVFLAIQESYDLAHTNACLLDIGGGSIEISFVISGQKIFTRSYPLGTVRLIEELKKRKLNESSLSLVLGENIQRIMEPVLEFTEKYSFDCLIGTGGNIECLGDLRKKICKIDDKFYVSFNDLSTIIQQLQSISYQQRIKQLGLRPDRADVIIPASLIVHLFMRQLETHNLMIPHVGLRDGLIYRTLLSQKKQ